MTSQVEGKPWRSLVVYVALAYALAWLVCLPIWLDARHLKSPWALPLMVLMMFTPTVASLLTLRLVEKKGFKESLVDVGLPVRSVGRLFAYLAIVAGLIYLFVLAALLTSSWLGVYHFDLANHSALTALYEQQAGGQPLPMPARTLAVVMIVGALLNGVLNTIPALGEEIGWRGFMFPRLQELIGAPGAIVASGLIWGCWHAPVILLGYNYPQGPRWQALLAMSGMCTFVGAALSWAAARAGTVWVAAYGHGLFNALFGAAMAGLGAAEPPVDMRLGTIMGVGGWIIPLVVVVLLFTVWRPRSGVGRPATAARL